MKKNKEWHASVINKPIQNPFDFSNYIQDELNKIEKSGKTIFKIEFALNEGRTIVISYSE